MSRRKRVHFSDSISEMVFENLTDPAGGSSDQPSPTENTKITKRNKIFAFFQRKLGIPRGPKSEREVDLVDEQQIPGPSCPKPEPGEDLVDEEQLCVPCPSGPKMECQMKAELSMLQMYTPKNVSQLEVCLCDSTLVWTPVTEVWHNVFIGDEDTAMDRAKLNNLGITHILNAAASEVDTGAEYYKGMNITYYDVSLMDDHFFDINNYFDPAAKFIHKALSNPENKVLVHSMAGISRSVTLFLAYLMIHHDIMVEDAIIHVINLRWISPSNGFLMQLTILNSHLVQQRRLQLRKQLDI